MNGCRLGTSHLEKFPGSVQLGQLMGMFEKMKSQESAQAISYRMHCCLVRNICIPWTHSHSPQQCRDEILVLGKFVCWPTSFLKLL